MNKLYKVMSFYLTVKYMIINNLCVFNTFLLNILKIKKDIL